MFASQGLPSSKIVCSMHQSNSSSFMPFQAKTGISEAAIAAAAWSCVENILHDDHLTEAPKATRVSIKTAVCMVIWIQPIILAPAKGFESPYFSRSFIKAGISASAKAISLRPKSARFRSATL